MNSVHGIVLAAGGSRRMGVPKVLLPWGGTTILGHVIETLAAAGLEDILVVTGAAAEHVEVEVATLAGRLPVRAVYNPDFAQGEMLSSIQAGLRALQVPPARSYGSGEGREGRAALIVLGDQPQAEPNTVGTILRAFESRRSAIIVPSFQRRRGHPWLIHSDLWESLLALRSPATARDFLKDFDAKTQYVDVTTPTILGDIDTPEDYARERPM